jgi:hypothetical protein
MRKWFYVHYRRLRPTQKDWSQSHYLPMEVRPGSLLREFLSDVRTALHRMGQRVDKLPFFYTLPVLPCFERDAKGNWIPNTHTHACMADMQRLENDPLFATNFDLEIFRIGWEAGAKWCEGIQSSAPTQYVLDHEENTSDSPVGPL